LIKSALGFAVREERIKSRADLFPLPGHHVDRVMQKNAAYFTSSIGHEDARIRLPPHQHRQRTDMILVRVRKQNGVEFSISQSLKIRQSFVPLIFRMHPRIQNKLLVVHFQIIGIRANFRLPRQIDEFQGSRPFGISAFAPAIKYAPA
jgi:hypothetical protein